VDEMTFILTSSNKKSAEEVIRKLLKKKGYECGERKEISFDLQFEVKFNNSKIGYYEFMKVKSI